MGYDIDKLAFKKGDRLAAGQLQAIVDAIRRPEAVIRGGPGLFTRQGPGGQVQITAASPPGGRVGLTKTAITPRAGAVPGTGTVTLQEFSGTAGDAMTAGLDVTAFLYLASSPGIAAGKYCWVAQDDNDVWWIVSAEC